MSVSTFDEVTKKKPEKSLIEPLKRNAGRNNQGRLTVRHQGGGSKRFYRRVDFKRDKFGVVAKVSAIEYDPNRSANIALLFYKDGEKRYILAPLGLKVGDEVQSGSGSPIRVGNALPLSDIPLGTQIHNIHGDDIDAKCLLNCVLDLNLVCVFRDHETVLTDLHETGILFSDHRSTQYVLIVHRLPSYCAQSW